MYIQAEIQEFLQKYDPLFQSQEEIMKFYL